MRLIDVVQEASRTGEYPRLNRRVAEQVLRAIAQWLDQQEADLKGTTSREQYHDAANLIYDELIIARSPR